MVAENLVTARERELGRCVSHSWRGFPTSPRSLEPPKQYSANICWINEWISVTDKMEISWTNTGLEEVYICV